MKKLYELIEDAERKLQICTEGEKPAIYFDLSMLYGFVNTDKSTAYEEKVFAANIETESELYISTQIAFGNSKLNMYEFEATAKIVQEALAKAEALNLTHQMHDALLLKAMLLLEQGKATESKVVFEECLAMHRLFNNAYSKTMCLCLFARVYDDISKVEAGKLLFKALDEIRQSDKKWVEGYVLYTLAEWAKGNGDSENTLQYLSEALRIFEEHKALAWLGLTLSTLADYYMLIGNYELALETNLKALKLLQAEANLREYVIGLSSTVKPLLALKRLQEAREYTQLGIDLSTKHHFNKQLAFFYSMQASVEMAESEFSKAIGSLKLSVESYGAEIPLSNLVSIKQKMAKCYEELGDYTKAYIAMVEYDEINTKLSDAERAKETVALNKKYETEKRESELRDLKIKQQQTELEQRESELKAIKAQMNPHFIFNALNSIQEMFFIGDKRLANEHLGKFSQLTREILKASGKAVYFAERRNRDA
jgi:tetratricopeptide (TPR) repeat protein